jgi:protein-tyrosine phosphatase
MNYSPPDTIIKRIKRYIPNRHKRRLKWLIKNCHDTYLYQKKLAGKEALKGPFGHVVFVCKGNICRSAFAEHYLKKQSHSGHLVIQSCGLDCDQGMFSPPAAVKVAKDFGVDLSKHRSQDIYSCDFKNADLILPMEFDHYLRLIEIIPRQKSKIRLLRGYAPRPAKILCDIHDPYGLEEKEYQNCFKILQRSIEGLKAAIT